MNVYGFCSLCQLTASLLLVINSPFYCLFQWLFINLSLYFRYFLSICFWVVLFESNSFIFFPKFEIIWFLLLFKFMADQGLVPSPDENIKRDSVIQKLNKVYFLRLLLTKNWFLLAIFIWVQICGEYCLKGISSI